MKLIDKIRNMVTEDEEYDYEEEEVEEEEDYFQRKPAKSAQPEKKVVNATPNFGSGLQVVIVKPERFEDAPSIGNHLCQKKTVILNLESASKEVAKRLIDFLSGVAYANKGLIKRVANSTFIITPANVDIAGDLVLEELENGTLYL